MTTKEQVQSDYDRWLRGQTETKRQAAIACNAKLAALVTPELAALLEGLARVMDETGIASGVSSVTDEIERAYALAARIREALALEVNDG